MLNHGLENREYVKLPEGVDIAITPAGVVSRSYAYIIDFLFRSLIMFVVSLVFSLLGDAGQGIILIIYFITSWGYNIFFEMKNGQTPGKKRLKIRVVQDNGLPASFSQIVVRNLLRPADMLPIGYFLGLVVMMFNSRFKRIGDWAAGTMVIYDDEVEARPELPKGNIEIPVLSLSTEEQLAVLAFAERSDELSDARRSELAAILAEPFKLETSEAQSMLVGYARFYSGQLSNSNEQAQSETVQ
ncbi:MULTISPECIES: RDD family protein [Pseudoalteromonas]|uniref:RDD family protein n=1 Tax=Pseudoalteromonas TaxID=53246 RepID=UPI0007827688|nr:MULTISPECIES: RDD family protein [Pseudoalteromonas]MCF7516933.1 RDD family protein [Pseudoalteromonas sp. L21]UJX24610.1 RDD family protein [Pseudoalteromonas sp. CF6-2]